MSILLQESFESGKWTHNVKVFPVEQPAYETQTGNIFTPEKWLFWFRHDPGNLDQPEGRYCWINADPVRIYSGNGAYMYFTFYRKHDAGLMRSVQVKPGTHVKLYAFAHAWSNWHDGPHPDDPRWSEGAGYEPYFALEGETEDDARRNFTFYVGIGPTGGTNPFSDTVVWGDGAHIYNEYAKVPEVEAVAENDTITIFLRSKCLWPFKHNDAYWDNVVLEVIDEEEEPCSDRGKPREQYSRTYLLLPQTADKEWALAAVTATHRFRYTVGYSADDAGIGDLDDKRVIVVNPSEWPGDIFEFFSTYYPGTKVEVIEAETPEDLIEAFLYKFTLGYPTTHMPPVITAPFGEDRGTYIHKGLDLRSSFRYWGDYILAAYDGEVISAGYADDGYGVRVKTRTILPDGRGLILLYAHLEPELSVSVGDFVTRGQTLGKAGRTGTTADHLHFGVMIDGEWVDPEPLIDWPEDEPQEFNGFGVHEDHNEEASRLMESCGVNGYILWTEGIGADPNDTSGKDYSMLGPNRGHTVIARLNYGYHSSGTIPTPDKYDDFAKRCANFVANSKGCKIWIIGNEMNNPREWPGNNNGVGGSPIEPELYADCFNRCYKAIKEVQPDSIVMPGAVDGYNAVWGDCREYTRIMWKHIERADAICVHAYTHGPDKELITADTYFGNEPLLGMHYDFKNFEDILEVIPHKSLPVFLTEINHLWKQRDPNPQNPDLGWVDENTGWIQTAYEYLSKNPRVVCGLLYRWPPIDPWVIHGKPNLIEDFIAAMKRG